MHRNHYDVRFGSLSSRRCRRTCRHDSLDSQPKDHMTVLDLGDRFPTVTINLADGKTIKLPEALAGAMGQLVPEDVIGLIGSLREHAAVRGVA
jgi:hypothetical protein